MVEQNPFTSKMNEAELQTFFTSKLREAFPLLPIESRLERKLRLRLGRIEMDVEGVSPNQTLNGRYDLVVYSENKPLLLVEFKAPDVKITDEAEKQALSYACAHVPLIPLTLITNGHEHSLHFSFDGSKVDPDEVSQGTLTSILAKASNLALSEAQDTLQTLLGTQPAIWQALFARWTEYNLAQLTGSLSEFHKPLIQTFSIPRGAAQELLEAQQQGKALILLHGPPLSGVTNTLAQLMDKFGSRPALFLDSHRCPNILQSLAGYLSQSLEFGVTVDQLRSWINARKGLVGLTLVIDGLPESGLEELVDLARRNLLQLIIGMETSVFETRLTLPGRRQGAFLSDADQVVALKPLTNEEFKAAGVCLLDSFSISFQIGADFAFEMRWPRALRVMVTALMQTSGRDSTCHPGETALVLSAVPNMHLLDACFEAFTSTPAFEADFRQLTKAFMKEMADGQAYKKHLKTTSGYASLSAERSEQELGHIRLNRLLEQGHLAWVSSSQSEPRLIIRLEELLAYHVAIIWGAEIAEVNSQNIPSVLDKMLEKVNLCPLKEMTLATALRFGLKDSHRIHAVINHLLPKRPELIGYSLSDPEKGYQWDWKGSAPWLVLSHLFMSLQAPAAWSLTVFSEMGKHQGILYRPQEPGNLKAEKNYISDCLQNNVIIPSPDNGIIEPLEQAMFNHSLASPDFIAGLVDAVIQEQDDFFAGRVTTVLNQLSLSIKPEIAEAAESASKRLESWWLNHVY